VQLCQAGVHTWVASDILQIELEQTPDLERRQLTIDWLTCASEQTAVSDDDFVSAAKFSPHGIDGFDAVHLAMAERARCDVFLTTDDRLSRRAEKPKIPALSLRVANPLAWILEQTV
jgi:predicted nucleic acid-binding protein